MEVICRLCGKPFEKYGELGPAKVPVWLHEYPTLKTCKAVRFNKNFVKMIMERDKAIGKLYTKNVRYQRKHRKYRLAEEPNCANGSRATET